MEFFTPEDEKRYQRGWPHAVELVDAHRDDAKPEKSFQKLYKHYLGVYHTRWPRKVAELFARAMSESVPEWPAPLSQKQAPINAELAHATLTLHVTKHSGWEPVQQEATLFVLEAFVGADVVLAALVDALETVPKAQWKGAQPNQCAAYYAYLAGYLLLRATPKTAKAERARLEALYDATVKAGATASEHNLRGGLDLALHGTDGAKRVFAAPGWQYLYFWGFVTDLAMVRERLKDSAAAEWHPDSRLVFNCGAELLEDFTTPKVTRGTARWRAEWLEQLGMFKHDAVVRLMVDQIGDKNAGSIPTDWIKAHAGWAVPRIEKMARGGGALEEKARIALRAVKG